MSRIIGAGQWLEEYGRVCKEGKVALLLRNGMRGDTVVEEVNVSMYYVLDKEVMAVKDRFWSPPPPFITL